MGNWRRICFSHYLTRTLFQNPLADLYNYRFDNMQGKAWDILKESLIYRFWLPHWYLQTLLEIINLISFLLSIFRPKNLCYKDDNYKILYVIKPNFCWIQLKTLQFDLQCVNLFQSLDLISEVYIIIQYKTPEIL
jgi:hypothetical protein